MNSNTRIIPIPETSLFRAFSLDLTNEGHIELVYSRVNKLLSMHEGLYARANDGSKSEKYIRDQESKMADIETQIENLATSLGAGTYWPGLYPVFTYNGREFHGMESLLKFISNEAKNVMENAK
jgi:hypothetical protein